VFATKNKLKLIVIVCRRGSGRDWRGGGAIPKRSVGMERKRNPGKRLKNGLLAIFFASVGGGDGPSTGSGTGIPLALSVCGKKWQGVCFPNICQKTKLPPKKEK